MVDEPGTTGFLSLDAVFNRHIEFPDRLLEIMNTTHLKKVAEVAVLAQIGVRNM